MLKEKGLHPKNIYNTQYDFLELSQNYSALENHIIIKHAHKTIDYSNPKSVIALNSALLKSNHNINNWSINDDNLCPAIPGRADYLYHINDLLINSKIKKPISVLDIGTGASCIYPILGTKIFDWNFIATDIDKKSLSTARKNITNNNLESKISLRLQNNSEDIINNIIDENDSFSISICNPPFYSSEADANQANTRKNKGLKTEGKKRNFNGKSNELWYNGGEKAFLHNYLYQSSLHKNKCFWYTTLVSKKDNVNSMQKSLKKLGAIDIKIIPMQHGNKISRIVAWTFLNDKEKRSWRS